LAYVPAWMRVVWLRGGCGVGAGGWLAGPGRRGVRNPSV